MKLQIKTLNRKSLVVDIEETKSVYELKKELSLYPDIGVIPELQKLIYAGKVLANEDKLSAYNIDAKKFLVIMILKQPLLELPRNIEESQQETPKDEAANVKEEEAALPKTKDTSTNSSTPPESEFRAPPEVPSKKDELVVQLVSMGYAEADVRRALAASFYNPERAIEYLIEGIPTSPSTPEGESYSDTDADLSITPFEVFRGDPTFQSLRSALQQHPDLLDAAIQRLAETNPSLLNLINENQQDFLSMLVDGSGDEDYDDNDMEDVDD